MQKANRVIFAIFAISFTLAIILLVALFGSQPSPQSSFHLKPDEKTILFAITPWGDEKKVREAYKPLISYLEDHLQKKIQFLIMEDYNVLNDNIAEGNIDLTVISPLSYIYAIRKEPNLKYVVTTLKEENGKIHDHYHGFIVALKSKYPGWTFDDFIKTPKKYSLGFVSKTSASGYAYPYAMMKKMGLDPYQTFKSVTFYESHSSLVKALNEGKVDLATIGDNMMFEAEKTYGKIYTIAYISDPIPASPWIASKNVDDATVNKLRQILTNIDKNNDLKTLLLKNAPDKGYKVFGSGFYDGIKEVVQYVEDSNK
jgi:phosphate/phosphite/phosphonate ABC transporter binding protein